MNMPSLALPAAAAYSETRQHELRKTRMLMIDGNLAVNSRTAESGISARVYHDGYWGFASEPGADAKSAQRVADKAQRNAREMSRFGPRAVASLPSGSYRGRPSKAWRPR